MSTEKGAKKKRRMVRGGIKKYQLEGIPECFPSPDSVDISLIRAQIQPFFLFFPDPKKGEETAPAVSLGDQSQQGEEEEAPSSPPSSPSSPSPPSSPSSSQEIPGLDDILFDTSFFVNFSVKSLSKLLDTPPPPSSSPPPSSPPPTSSNSIPSILLPFLSEKTPTKKITRPETQLSVETEEISQLTEKELRKIAKVMRVGHEKSGILPIPISPSRLFLQTVMSDCFSSKTCIDWMMCNLSFIETRSQGVALGQIFLEKEWFKFADPIQDSMARASPTPFEFTDTYIFYKFGEKPWKGSSVTFMSRGDLFLLIKSMAHRTDGVKMLSLTYPENLLSTSFGQTDPLQAALMDQMIYPKVQKKSSQNQLTRSTQRLPSTVSPMQPSKREKSFGGKRQGLTSSSAAVLPKVDRSGRGSITPRREGGGEREGEEEEKKAKDGKSKSVGSEEREAGSNSTWISSLDEYSFGNDDDPNEEEYQSSSSPEDLPFAFSSVSSPCFPTFSSASSSPSPPSSSGRIPSPRTLGRRFCPSPSSSLYPHNPSPHASLNPSNHRGIPARSNSQSQHLNLSSVPAVSGRTRPSSHLTEKKPTKNSEGEIVSYSAGETTSSSSSSYSYDSPPTLTLCSPEKILSFISSTPAEDSPVGEFSSSHTSSSSFPQKSNPSLGQSPITDLSSNLSYPASAPHPSSPRPPSSCSPRPSSPRPASPYSTSPGHPASPRPASPRPASPRPASPRPPSPPLSPGRLSSSPARFFRRTTSTPRAREPEPESTEKEEKDGPICPPSAGFSWKEEIASSCFFISAAIEWLQKNEPKCQNRGDAAKVVEAMIKIGLIQTASSSSTVDDTDFCYLCFPEPQLSGFLGGDSILRDIFTLDERENITQSFLPCHYGAPAATTSLYYMCGGNFHVAAFCTTILGSRIDPLLCAVSRAAISCLSRPLQEKISLEEIENEAELYVTRGDLLGGTSQPLIHHDRVTAYLDREKAAQECFDKGKIFVDGTGLPPHEISHYFGSFLASSFSSDSIQEESDGLLQDQAVSGVRYTSSGHRYPVFLWQERGDGGTLMLCCLAYSQKLREKFFSANLEDIMKEAEKRERDAENETKTLEKYNLKDVREILIGAKSTTMLVAVLRAFEYHRRYCLSPPSSLCFDSRSFLTAIGDESPCPLPTFDCCVTISFGRKEQVDSLDLEFPSASEAQMFVRKIIYLSGAVPVLAPRHNVTLWSYYLCPSPGNMISAIDGVKILSALGAEATVDEFEKRNLFSLTRSKLYDILIAKSIPPPISRLFRSTSQGRELISCQEMAQMLRGFDSHLSEEEANDCALQFFSDWLRIDKKKLQSEASLPPQQSGEPQTPNKNSDQHPKYGITLEQVWRWLIEEIGAGIFRRVAFRVPSLDELLSPISSFFVSSSHNTYLEGNQFSSRSTGRQYAKVLRDGCRCIEIDTWDGDDHIPVVWHGNTLTSKASLPTVLKCIRDFAFCSSDLPLIISIENHCSFQQQVMMARLFLYYLGRFLVLNQMCGQFNPRCDPTLPSPLSLRRRILLKGKGDRSRAPVELIRILYLRSTPPSAQYKRVQSDLSKRSATGTDLSVIFDTQTGKSKPGEVKRVVSDFIVDPTLVCSVSEANFEKQKTDFPLLSWRTLVRTYPKGARINSSNYNPMWVWSLGGQLASLNYQYQGKKMELERVFFQRAAGSGFVLQPSHLRKVNLEMSSQTKKFSRKRRETIGSRISGDKRPNRKELLDSTKLTSLPKEATFRLVWFCCPSDFDQDKQGEEAQEKKGRASMRKVDSQVEFKRASFARRNTVTEMKSVGQGGGNLNRATIGSLAFGVSGRYGMQFRVHGAPCDEKQNLLWSLRDTHHSSFDSSEMQSKVVRFPSELPVSFKLDYPELAVVEISLVVNRKEKLQCYGRRFLNLSSIRNGFHIIEMFFPDSPLPSHLLLQIQMEG